MNILVAGDFCPRYRVVPMLEGESFATVLGDVKSIVSAADYSIVNFECPVVADYESPIIKQGPSLKCTLNSVKAIKWVGFNCVTLANNHFRDYGDDGVKNTIATCSENGLDIVGGGLSLKEASKVLYKNINGKKIAIVNCCEHEFSIAAESRAGANPLNPVKQYYAIKDARLNANNVIVIVHGGHEYYQLPSPRMVELYRFFIDAGADAVINHHQHCFSGYEYYQGKPIIYGLGNFCFDKKKQESKTWNEGYMVMLNIETNEVGFKLYPYIQCREEPRVKLMNDNQEKAFRAEISKLCEIISSPSKLSEEHESFISHKADAFISILSPFNSRILRSLVRRKVIPNFISKAKVLLLYNRISCEAHRDIMLGVLNRKIESYSK